MPVLKKLKTLFGSNSTTSNTSITSTTTSTGTTTANAPPPPPTTFVTPPTPLLTSPPEAFPSTIPSLPTTSETMAPVDTPAFDPSSVTVIFVLGGPGAGKGTQCAKLVEEFGFKHLSAGDLLRAEQTREGSSYGALIKEYIKEGKIVPMEVTIKLLENAMRDLGAEKEKGMRFLVDGFPRQMDQAVKFDESVCPSSLVLFLVCPEETLQERLLERGKTSGRDDDNAESIKKRFKTFIETSMPVVDYYRKQGKVVDIDSSKSIEKVYEEIKESVKKVL